MLRPPPASSSRRRATGIIHGDRAPVPAGLAAALGSAAALVIAFAGPSPGVAAMIASLALAAGALAAITAGARAGKPVSVQLCTAAAAVICTDLALAGIRMTAAERGAVVAAAGAFLTVALHLVHVTVTASRAPARAAPPSFPVRPSTPAGAGTEADLLERRIRYTGPWVPPDGDAS